jgi:hypothetical protein
LSHGEVPKDQSLRRLKRFLWGLGLLAIAVGGFGLWVWWPGAAPDAPSSQGSGAPPPEVSGPRYIPSIDPPSTPLAGAPPLVGGAPEACDGGAAPASASAVNGASLTTLAWTPFDHAETGWEIYAPRVAAEIGTTCGPATPRFAAALADWQSRKGRQRTGVFDPETFGAMLVDWHLARPFVRVNRQGICPGAPPASALATATPRESYGGKTIQLRPGALAAYRDMAAEAKAAGVLRRPEALTLFSGFRDPDADAARCARDNNCQGVVRTICSAHRTGLAIDVFVEAAPGFGPDSSADANRLAMARSPLFKWMVVNAGRFGFVNYAYEPWHWEWTGETMLPGVPIVSLPKAGSEPAAPPDPGPKP